MINSLKRNEIDFAFISIVPEGLEGEEDILLENRLYLVGKEKTFNKDRPMIFRESGSATRIAMEAYFSKQKTQTRKRLALTSNEAVKQAIVSGIGYSILPLIGIKHELFSGEVHIIQKKGLPIQTNWRLIWHRNKKLHPVASAFLDYIREYKEQINQEHFSWYLTYRS